MELLYLIFLNLGDFFKLVFYMIPGLVQVLLSMWQFWIGFGVIVLFFIAESILQYFFIDKYDTLEE